MPERYAKAEMSSGFVGTIDTYAYRSPISLRIYGPAVADAESTPPTEPIRTTQLAGDEGVEHAQPH